MLFPEQSAPVSGKLVRLNGLAKMAAEAVLLEEKRRVEYRELPARSYITRCSNPDLPFQWTINPYRGCEYGCKYCYARYTHEFMELRESESFETLIFAKTWNRQAFAEELRHTPFEQNIAIGTATDPYQPAERRFGVTRQMLEVIAAHAEHQGIWLTTKSDLVARDVDLFKEIARRGNEVSVNITITSLDRDLARAIEPFAPRPDLRLEAVRQLAAAGVFVCVNCSPIMPLINDSEESIHAVAKAARQAGASAFWANLVFLKDCAKAVFLPFLQTSYPAAYRRYKHHFGNAAYLQGPYVDMIRKRVLQAKEQHGFNRGGSAREGRRLPQVESPQTGFQWE
jgi:DNA repair photolyase